MYKVKIWYDILNNFLRYVYVKCCYYKGDFLLVY